MAEMVAKTADECKHYCKVQNDSGNWQFASMREDHNGIHCRCTEFLFNGFKTGCDRKGKSPVSWQLWQISCPELTDLPSKNMYLRAYHASFHTGTKARYECAAGFIPQTPAELKTMSCGYNMSWTPAHQDLPACSPITCTKAPFPDDPILKGNKLSYQILLDKSKSLAGTAFQYSCPAEKFFVNRIDHIEAICTTNG